MHIAGTQQVEVHLRTALAAAPGTGRWAPLTALVTGPPLTALVTGPGTVGAEARE